MQVEAELDCEFEAENEDECFCTAFTIHYLAGDIEGNSEWIELTEEDFTKEEWGRIEDIVDGVASEQDAHGMHYMQQVANAEAYCEGDR